MGVEFGQIAHPNGIPEGENIKYFRMKPPPERLIPEWFLL